MRMVSFMYGMTSTLTACSSRSILIVFGVTTCLSSILRLLIALSSPFSFRYALEHAILCIL
ncbi:putative lipoprotein [Neorickettsia sennetsu str. Miyayama]|uniref:Lipoprotein n=1 Tax=Ehrlichia sennetsu (strain ATCC VR-367 / Miyayama) TaxID=222891 RepID=Q2GDP5_EHRS3|nr:putative lipoprotein [Neorickettsia sennetsu str. Miyayama]